MKLGQLKSLGHNIADSFASGIGLLVGCYDMNVFAEASATAPGFIEVDFLSATTSGSPVSPSLLRAIGLYRDALPGLCEKHGIDAAAIKVLSARFGTDATYGPHFTVVVETTDDRTSTDLYIGSPGRRFRDGRK